MAEMGVALLKDEIAEIKKKISENRKVIDGFSNYLRQAALGDQNNIENIIRTIGLERDRAEIDIQMLERHLANKENQLSELTSDKQEKGLKDYLVEVLKTFDTQDDAKKRLIIQTIIPRIELLPKNKLRLHIRTDFRDNTRHRQLSNDNSKTDFGHRGASYQPPVGLETRGEHSILGAVTSGGNFSSRN